MQAVGSLVGLGVAIYIPYWQREVSRREEAQKRLTILSKRRNLQSGIEVRLSYRPESTHEGYLVRVAVLSPASVRALPMVRRQERSPNELHAQVVTAPDADREWLRAAEVKFGRLNADPDDGQVRGSIFLIDTPVQAIAPAKVEIDIEVLSTADGHQVLKRRLWISPAY